jgi:hypothetical protein
MTCPAVSFTQGLATADLDPQLLGQFGLQQVKVLLYNALYIPIHYVKVKNKLNISYSIVINETRPMFTAYIHPNKLTYGYFTPSSPA